MREAVQVLRGAVAPDRGSRSVNHAITAQFIHLVAGRRLTAPGFERIFGGGMHQPRTGPSLNSCAGTQE